MALLAVACGGTRPGTGDAGTGTGGADSAAPSDTGAHADDGASAVDANAARCALDPAGSTFTFHVHNTGTSPVYLDFGCGRSIPITVKTASGDRGIGPGPADACERSCIDVYAAGGATGCSDCGPPQPKTVAAGATFDIAWDRLAYVGIPVDTTCAPGGGSCALGQTVPSSASQAGTLTVCTLLTPTSGCASSEGLTFTVDTTASEGTLTVP